VAARACGLVSLEPTKVSLLASVKKLESSHHFFVGSYFLNCSGASDV
jgi:hypothetical protein